MTFAIKKKEIDKVGRREEEGHVVYVSFRWATEETDHNKSKR